MSNELKQLIFNVAPKRGAKKEIVQKPKEKRKVTLSSKWTFSTDDFTIPAQMARISTLQSSASASLTLIEDPLTGRMKQEISHKLYGYKHQDMKKNLYDENEFITFHQTIEKLLACQFKCFYCNKNVNVLYEEVRDPTQWSLERIDNTFGHNYNNIVIACLYCNLHRRTIYYERYIQTKQIMNIQKCDSQGRVQPTVTIGGTSVTGVSVTGVEEQSL